MLSAEWSERLEAAYQMARDRLLEERTPAGHWVGELSASALSTATAISALALVQRNTDAHESFEGLIDRGAAWLAEHQNADGGWGDTVKSHSNISTTMLCRAAFHLTGTATRHRDILERADAYLRQRFGATSEEQAEAVRQRYGKDRTFAVPILTTCALAGLVSWKEVPSLPFELACLPQSLYRFLRLRVVSYALPALIAIGQCVYHHKKPWNPLAWVVRWLSVRRSLRVLESIQPDGGGFLEATPLTSFVTLSLASIGRAEHSVARNGVQFIVRSVRPDGSWPIDTNLSTWVTTLSINALALAPDMGERRHRYLVEGWLRKQQFKVRHPYTGADPGGWGWTPLPGSVPDADDTPGAILALYYLNPWEWCPVSGLCWLLDLQNSDGGWPTFCRGWGHLPFDRSGTDLTAHVLRALNAWKPRLEHDWSLHDRDLQSYTAAPYCTDGFPIRPRTPPITPRRFDQAFQKGLAYLKKSQRSDGSWLPLWFGNQHAPDDFNPVYGTARVLAAYRDLGMMDLEPARKGVAFLLSAQNDDGGWGGAKSCPSSVEETALAVEALLEAGPSARDAVNKGLCRLVEQVERGGLEDPTPIGFYFAKLWYFEKLYPIIFAVAALGRARRLLSRRPSEAHPEPTSS